MVVFVLVDKSIIGRADRATQTVDLGSITSWVKPNTVKLVFTAVLLDVQL